MFTKTEKEERERKKNNNTIILITRDKKFVLVGIDWMILLRFLSRCRSTFFPPPRRYNFLSDENVSVLVHNTNESKGK